MASFVSPNQDLVGFLTWVSGPVGTTVSILAMLSLVAVEGLMIWAWYEFRKRKVREAAELERDRTAIGVDGAPPVTRRRRS